MFNFSMMDKAIRVIKEGAMSVPSEKEFIAHEIQRTKSSQQWRWKICGDDYYNGRQDILRKTRTAIGEDGQLTVIDNLPNNKQTDNVYRRMVKQKTNYLLGKPFSVTSDDDSYQEALTYIFDKAFMRKMKGVGTDALNCGMAWLYPYYDENGEFNFKRFRPYEIIPEWKDVDHTQLDSVIRFYDVDMYDGLTDKKITKVELYTLKGVDYFEYYNGSLVPCSPWHQDYITVNGKGYNWDKLPFVAFKYNAEEIPLIVNCKSLQDGLNRILSNFEDNMEEDSRNTILVLVNYDGENLGEFRRNLATYGAVKVRSDGGGAGGDLKTLQVEVSAENYKTIAGIFKQAIIENCMGYDVKDEKLSGNPNQMNIQSMYNDIDLDASDMEIEFQAAMDELLYFIDLHLINTGVGDFTQSEATITFNTNMPMDEATTIQNLQNSTGILSTETLVAHHPWVTNVDEELDRLNKEKEEQAAQYGYGLFGQQNTQPTGGEDGDGDE